MFGIVLVLHYYCFLFLGNQGNQDSPRMPKIDFKKNIQDVPGLQLLLALQLQAFFFFCLKLKSPLILFLLCVQDQETGRSKKKNAGSGRGRNEGTKAHHCQNGAERLSAVSDLPCLVSTLSLEILLPFSKQLTLDTVKAPGKQKKAVLPLMRTHI